MGLIQGRQLSSPVLRTIQQDVEAKIPDEIKRDYLAIVVAGLKVMYSDQTHQMSVQALMQAIRRVGLMRGVAFATVGLIQLVYRESKGQMSIPAAFPAAYVLLCYVFEFVMQAMKQPITKPMVGAATLVVTKGLMQFFGITKEKLAQGVEQARQQPGAGSQASPAGAPEQIPQGGA